MVGLFHPYCNAGGGGERVLWCAVRSIQIRYPDFNIVIYTGDRVASETMLQNAKQKFNVEIREGNLQFITLKCRNWVEATNYPYFTLIGQSLGSMVLGMEAIWKLVPGNYNINLSKKFPLFNVILIVLTDIFIDTMGYSFTFPIFRYLGGCKIACYVHYPTISTDMLSKVASGTAAFNNSSFISKSQILTLLKTIYYHLFAWLYGVMGRRADAVMVNSSWTEEHINSIWKNPLRTYRVYPPCDVKEFAELSVDPDPESFRIIAVAQFRPEKDHPLMIRSFHKLFDFLTDEEKKRVKLVLVGSCRNKEDDQRVKDY